LKPPLQQFQRLSQPGNVSIPARPAPPPVYRPDQTPRALLQPKLAGPIASRTAQSPKPTAAPPVYRPQNLVPPLLQQKPVTSAVSVPVGQRYTATAVNPAGTAPPVYRLQTNQQPLQLKPSAIAPVALAPPPINLSSSRVLQLGRKKKKEEGKKKKSKVKARDGFETDYMASARQVDQNFNAYASASISDTTINERNFFDFTLTVGNEEYKAHLTMKPSYQLAHVTTNVSGRLVNYYYLVTGPGAIETTPPSRLVSGGATEKNLTDMPTEYKTPILAMLRNIYA
jgi:hypothetical protein